MVLNLVIAPSQGYWVLVNLVWKLGLYRLFIKNIVDVVGGNFLKFLGNFLWGYGNQFVGVNNMVVGIFMGEIWAINISG